MKLDEMFKKQTIYLDLDADSRDDLIEKVGEKLADLKVVKSKQEFVKGILKREEQDSTGMGDGIAIPHILNETVNDSRIVFVRSKKMLDWNAMDGQPVNKIFFIMTNGKDGNEHLEALGNLSGVLVNADNIKKLDSAKNADDVLKVFSPKNEVKKETKLASGHYDVVGITACPTGIAHTYLAAEKIQEYAKKLGLTAKIETQGRRGTEDRLTQEDVDNAKVIFLAHDKALMGMNRFNGKKAIDTGTKDAIFKGDQIISDALEGKGLKEIHASAKEGEDSGEMSLKKFKDIKGNLLAGVSRMLPFVVAGGIILGIGFLIDFASGNGKAEGDFGTVSQAAGWFSALGKLSMQMMIPILAAYICYSIVGPQGLMPGIVAGLTTSNLMSFAYGNDGSWANMWGRLLPFDSHESGFIGAILGAYIAAFIVYGWSKAMAKFPKGIQGVRDIVFIPVLSLLCTGLAMFVINIPIGYVMSELSEGIKWLANHDLILLVSALFGVMMCFDMGGPINKIAYTLGTLTVGGQLITNSDAAGLGQQQILMASAMLAGMLPPIMIAMCTVIFPRVWSAKDRDAAKVNWVMGAFFVTEGAIPFMIKDPKRIAASAMTGGLIIGILCGVLKLSWGAPHGGIAVLPLLKTGLGNADYALTGSSIGLGIAMGLILLIGASAISAVILGFWRLADIKKGKLVLDDGDGIKEKYEQKIISLNEHVQKHNARVQETGKGQAYDEAKKTKLIATYDKKIAKASEYQESLKVKQAAWQQTVQQKQQAKLAKKSK